MRYLRLMAIGTVLLLMVAACSKTENTEEMVVDKTENTLFDYVPSDTPYLAGNLEPTPDEVIEVFLQRFQPVFDSVQSELGTFRQTLQEEAVHNEHGSKLANAVLQELDGKLNRQGMESLGFDLRTPGCVWHGRVSCHAN